MTAVSKGYDSPAVSVIARSAAVQDAVTISTTRRSAGRLFDLDDCGENVAKQLGLNSRGYRRTRIYYPFEDAVWASVGNIEDVNLTVFDYLQPLLILLARNRHCLATGSRFNRRQRNRQRMSSIS